MSATTAPEPRPVLYHADDFNRRISEEVDAFDLKGQPQKMSYDAFVCHVMELLDCLKGRVEEFNKLSPSKLSNEEIQLGKGLKEQYEQFNALVVVVEIVADELFEMLNHFDLENGRKWDGASTIKSPFDVDRVAKGYKKRMEAIRYEYFTEGVLPKNVLPKGLANGDRYLANMIVTLQNNLDLAAKNKV